MHLWLQTLFKLLTLLTKLKTTNPQHRILHLGLSNSHAEEPRVRNFHSARRRPPSLTGRHRLHLRRVLVRSGRHIRVHVRRPRGQQREWGQPVPELQEHAEDLRGEKRTSGEERAATSWSEEQQGRAGSKRIGLIYFTFDQ